VACAGGGLIVRTEMWGRCGKEKEPFQHQRWREGKKYKHSHAKLSVADSQNRRTQAGSRSDSEVRKKKRGGIAGFRGRRLGEMRKNYIMRELEQTCIKKRG